MRLINGRQAWHDAYCPNIKSTTAFSLKYLQLGVAVEKEEHHIHDQIIHQWLAGKVQHCIDSLPTPLKCFGHHLYSPLGSLYDLEVAHELVWCVLSKNMHKQKAFDFKQDQAYWLVRAALKRYQNLIVNKKDHLHTSTAVIKYLNDNFQITLQKSDWEKWQSFYNNILFICGELDKQALLPIEHLIREFKKIN